MCRKWKQSVQRVEELKNCISWTALAFLVARKMTIKLSGIQEHFILGKKKRVS
jgi:hypothetical protein